MSESSTDEKEGWQEAPEQPEPPRVRGDSPRKTVLPVDANLGRLVHDSSPEILTAVAADARLTEDLALALLNHRDLPREALEALSKNGQLARLRCHPLSSSAGTAGTIVEVTLGEAGPRRHAPHTETELKITPQCVLFDLDGTLVDTAPDLGLAANLVLC